MSKPLLSQNFPEIQEIHWWICIKRRVLASIGRGTGRGGRERYREGKREGENMGDICGTLKKMS